MASAQVTSRPATPAKAASSSAAPRAADPRGNSRTPAPQRSGQGKVTVTAPAPYRGGSDKAKAAISGAVGSVFNPKNWQKGPITDAVKAVGWLGSDKNPVNRVGIGPTSNPNAPIPSAQRQRAATSSTERGKEAVTTQGVKTNRSPVAGFPAGPNQPAGAGRPAPGRSPIVAFKGGPTGSGTAQANQPAAPATSGPGAVGLGAPARGAKGATPAPVSGQPASGKQPSGAAKNTGAPAGGATAPTKAPSGAPAATPQPGKGKPTPPATGPQTGGVAAAPFGENEAPRSVGGVQITMPARVDLGDINQQAMGQSIRAKIVEAGGMKNLKEGAVLTTFKGAAGVPWSVTVKNGKLTVVRGTSGPVVPTPGSTAAASAPEAPDATAPATPAEAAAAPGQSASDFVTNQLLNNPALGMGATNNEAKASLVALAAKTGLAIAGPDGAIVDPTKLLGGDPNKPFDPNALKDYKLVLASGPSSGQAVTGQNYLDLQVNPDVGGQDTSLVGTELGNLILRQKQARAQMLEEQNAGGLSGGAAGAQRDRDATSRALGFTDFTRGTIGGGIADIQKGRQEGFQKALAKMLENPEAYGYQGAAPTTSTPGPAAATTPPSSTDTKKTFKIGEVKTWGGKKHRYNGEKWVVVKPPKTKPKK